MKITDVKTWAVQNPSPQRGGAYWIFLKLTTDDGIVGYGEVYGVPFAPSVVCRMIEDVAERYAIGRSPFETETLWRLMYSSAFTQRPDVSMGGVISGIDIACWDIIGKATNQPIYNLMGGKVHERLRSYTYLYPAIDPKELSAKDFHGDPDAAPNRLQEYIDMGFTAVGFDPIMPMGSFDPRMPALNVLEGAERFTSRMREVAGSQCDLLIKTHGQMTTAGAIRFARRMERFDPFWFEEPVPPGNSKEMARVAAATTIPIAAGERLVSRFEIAPLLEAQGAQILQPALGRLGGIMEGKKVAAMAEAHYAQFAPHLFAGPVELAANIQLSACLPNFLILETIETSGGFFSELLDKPFRWEDGYVIVPEAPGLGFELNEEMLDANPVTVDDVFPPMASTPIVM